MMARPIEATPVLYGDDARRLLDDLQRVCSPEEARRRIESGKRTRAELMRAKGDEIYSTRDEALSAFERRAVEWLGVTLQEAFIRLDAGELRGTAAEAIVGGWRHVLGDEP